MNALTDSDVVVAGQLFATLICGSTSPAAERQGGDPTDTRREFVGKLPRPLEAFRSTLEEVARATVVLHVADASSAALLAQIEAVRDVLGEIGAGAVPEVLALNKIDVVSEHERARLLERFDGAAVAISALAGEGLRELLEKVEAAIPRFPMAVTILVPYGREDVTAMLHREAEVLSEEAREDGTLVHARVGERGFAAVREFRVDPAQRAAG
jgi:GTP-binding protein HflX